MTADIIFEKLRTVLCDMLILNPSDVQLHSKLVDDLDADSIAFLELTFCLRQDFGLEIPQTKVDEEMLTLPLLDGLQRLREAEGGVTLFEFMPLASGEALSPELQAAQQFSALSDEQKLAQAQRMTVGDLAAMMGTTPPASFAAEQLMSELRVRDLFRFITVQSYVRYVQHLQQLQVC